MAFHRLLIEVLYKNEDIEKIYYVLDRLDEYAKEDKEIIKATVKANFSIDPLNDLPDGIISPK